MIQYKKDASQLINGWLDTLCILHSGVNESSRALGCQAPVKYSNG